MNEGGLVSLAGPVGGFRGNLSSGAAVLPPRKGSSTGNYLVKSKRMKCHESQSFFSIKVKLQT